jgi:hypothetical protein
MLRWLLLAFIIYLIIRIFFNYQKKKTDSPFSIFFGHNHRQNSNKKNRSGSSLEHIEEAEYEDITEKETKNKKDSTSK